MAMALTGQEMSGEQVELSCACGIAGGEWTSTSSQCSQRILGCPWEFCLKNGVTLVDPNNILDFGGSGMAGLPAFGSPRDPIWRPFWGCASCASVALHAGKSAVHQGTFQLWVCILNWQYALLYNYDNCENPGWVARKTTLYIHKHMHYHYYVCIYIYR